MSQTKTKKSPTKKSPKQPTNIYKYTTIILALTSLGLLAGLIVTATQTKSFEEKEYLALYDHLMYKYPIRWCDSNKEAARHFEDYVENTAENTVCQMTSYGISQDNDPYVSFTEYVYDAETHQEKPEKARKMTLYFQHRPDNGGTGYSEAIGYDD